MFLSRCQVKILDNSLTKVILSTLEPLLFKWRLLLFKCCTLILLVWSIKQMFLSLHISLRCVFTSWSFWLNSLLSVLRMMFDILTSQFSPFIEHATLARLRLQCLVKSYLGLGRLFLHKGLYDLGLFAKTLSCNPPCNLLQCLKNAWQKSKNLFLTFPNHSSWDVCVYV